MSWLWILYAIGFWPILVLAVSVLIVVLFLTGSIGMDGLFAAAEEQGSLTCWHCKQETPAGRHRCIHCEGELQ